MNRMLRWSDNDHYFGPFTWAYSRTYPHWAVVLKSRGDEDDGASCCSLRISLHRITLLIALPSIILPWKEKVYPNWDAETVARPGRNWYWNVDPRKYGFSLSDGHLSLYFGRTGGCCFLPWTQWRHVRHSLYNLDGSHFWTEPEEAGYESYRDAKNRCQKAAFLFEDFDGAKLTATTMIEEREWHFGTGWCSWLSFFRPARVCRSLNIEFSGETGPEKGSWKGGTIGAGIEMLPGENHEAAFRRYCSQPHRSKYRDYAVKFLHRIPEVL